MTASPITGTAITEEGAELFWASYGTGPALLLIAGQASTHKGWLPLVPRLAANHRVVLYDHRAIGRSRRGEPGPFTTRSFASDACAVLDAAGIELASVYGHSMGGRVAQWLAIDHPERLDKLILASTTGGDRLDPPRLPEAGRLLASGKPEQMAPLFFTEPYCDAHPDVVHEFFVRDASISVRRAHYEASTGHDAWDELGGISAPTLIVHGADDPVTSPQNARELAQRIPGSQTLIVAGQRHCPHLECERVTDEVERFLAS